MKKLTLLISFVLIGFLAVDELHAQRRGGGGRSFSGGGARSFSGGGGASRSFSGGSNMSRSFSGGSSYRPSSMPGSFQRPSTGYQRPSSTMQRPSSMQRPSTGSLQRPSGSSLRRPSGSSLQRPSGSSMQRQPGTFQRPSGSSGNTFRSSNAASSTRTAGASRSQLNDFLNMPSSSSSSASRTRAESRGTPNESGGRTFQGENYTVDTFRGSGSGSKNGVDYGGAGAGAVITDSQGNQRVVGKGVGGATDGTNSVVGGGSVAAGKNADGSAGAVRSGTRVATDGTNVAASRGVVGGARDSQGNVRVGAAGGWAATDGQNAVGGAGSFRAQSNVDGSGGYVARGARGATDGTNAYIERGASAGVQDRYGNARGATVGGYRATDGVNTWGGAAGARYVRDPRGNVYARGGYATGFNGIVTSSGQVYAVRNGYRGRPYYYHPGWYTRYPGAWFVAGMAAAAWYYPPSYGYVSGYTGCDEQPVSYDYGNEGIYVENGNVYLGDEVIATQEEYYNEATEIADGFAESENPEEETAEDWMPLGVFAVVSEGQSKSDMILQLAINKEGMVRGNLTLELTDEVIPVQGKLDKETQKVAFRLEGKEDVVAEAGLYNLTEDVLTVMVHQGPDTNVERGLVRIPPEEEEGESKDQPSK